MAARIDDPRRDRQLPRSRRLYLLTALTRRNVQPKEKAMGREMKIAAAISVVTMLLSPMANAQPIADFYRGKSLRMLIGYGPGGGYDIYGRLVAEFLPRYLPGKPTIIPQNMPGAGSFAAASYIQDAAPKDGTVFGSLAQTLALDSMTNASARVDVAK